MKKIVFAGTTSEDIMMHLARYLDMKGFSVAISNNDRLFVSSEIPFTDEVDQDEADICLFSAGMNRNVVAEADVTVIVTDMLPANARRIATAFSGIEEEKNTVYVIRDALKNGKARCYIRDILKAAGDTVDIEEDTADLFVRCGIQEGVTYRLTDLSKGMQNGLIRLYEALRIEESEKTHGKRSDGQKWRRRTGFMHR